MSIMVWSFFLLLTDFTKVAPARHITDQEWFQSQWWDKTLSWANIAFSTSCFWTACTSMMSTVRGLGSVESVGMEALNDPWISCLYTPSRRRGPPFTSTFMFYILRLGNITLASLKPWSSEPFSIYCSELNWYYIYIYIDIKNWLPDFHSPVVAWALRPAAVAILQLATPAHEARIKRIARMQKSVPYESLLFPLGKFIDIMSFPFNVLRCSYFLIFTNSYTNMSYDT